MHQKTLCGTTLIAAPSRDTTAPRLQAQADAVTGITRPLLLTDSHRFSEGGSKVIFRFHSSPSCTKRRFSPQELKSYSSFSTPNCSVDPPIIPRFSGLSTALIRFHPQRLGGVMPFHVKPNFFHFSQLVQPCPTSFKNCSHASGCST